MTEADVDGMAAGKPSIMDRLSFWYREKSLMQRAVIVGSAFAAAVIFFAVLISVSFVSAFSVGSSRTSSMQVTQTANPDTLRAIDLLRKGLELSKQKDDGQDQTLVAHDKKFVEVDRKVSDLKQQVGALSDAQKADPETAKALKAQVDALEKLVKSMQTKTDADAKSAKDRISTLESIVNKLNPISSAQAQTAPPAPSELAAADARVTSNESGVRQIPLTKQESPLAEAPGATPEQALLPVPENAAPIPASQGGYRVAQTTRCQLDFTVFSRRLGRCVPR